MWENKVILLLLLTDDHVNVASTARYCDEWFILPDMQGYQRFMEQSEIYILMQLPSKQN